MKRTLALGGIAAGLLASAAIAAPAHAADEIPAVNLANTNFAAKQVAAFWYGENKANLINATPYNVETTVPTRHVSTGGASADSKAGVVGSSGDQKPATATLKNINLPKTTGKVFFIGGDGKPHWCSATSVQSGYKNLVATAGHCVYDTATNKETLDKWVFIPGYYQGKTPWGIYVGKTAYTHYDYDVYEDGDRDYAFVTVYNGVQVTDVAVDKVKNWVKDRVFDTRAEAEKAKKDLELKTTGWSGEIVPVVDHDTVVRNRHDESKREYVNLCEFLWAQGGGYANRTLSNNPTTAEAEDLASKLNQARGGTTDFKVSPGTGVTVTRISRTEFDGAWWHNDEFGISKDFKTFYFAYNNGWYKVTLWVNYDIDYKLRGHIVDIALKDVGTLGSNVGGQGLAYNQKIGSAVFVFGYPSGSHPDGNYAFTGKTLKWAYGKTFKAAAPAMKAEELVGIKSSFTGEGSIGSSWLYRYSNTKRLGYLNGVTIAVSDTDGNKRIDTSVSPYFDGETLAVYQYAAKFASGKIV
ncbi:trypsin-like serine peptidase [Microbispora siamensis]